MVHIEIQDTRVARVNAGLWMTLPRHEFLLLNALFSRRRQRISFFDLQKELWGFEDENETPLLVLTRIRLLRVLKRLKRNVNWDNIIHRDRSLGYRLCVTTEQRADEQAASS